MTSALLNLTGDSVTTGNALSLFAALASNPDVPTNSNATTMKIRDIDRAVASLTNFTSSPGVTTSFIMAQTPKQPDGNFILGAVFNNGRGGAIVQDNNRSDSLTHHISVAAILSPSSVANLTSLNIFVIETPTVLKNIDRFNNKTMASSMVVASTIPRSAPGTINITLAFTVLSEFKPNVTADYSCEFYDTNSLRWSSSGCTPAVLNTDFQRYECSCNHLTSFALVWLPQTLLSLSDPRTLRPFEIASFVFQSLSILCFLAIIIHALVARAISPMRSLQASDLLPLVSCASTVLLFVVYIALVLTTFTRTTSVNDTQCFLSSDVLIFSTYFCLVFMFCAKISVGYFNYLRFVHLFPRPSFRRLFVLLGMSLLFSVGWVAFAAGFNTISSLDITQLYPYRLRWFPRHVIYYFLTVPVCLFLLLNTFMIIFVTKHIISHVRHATSSHQSYERAKRCVIVLLSSCITQGVGWLFGPFLSFVDPTAGLVLEWFFNAFNGLEGVWSIVLYVIIQPQGIDEQRRVKSAVELSKTTTITSLKYRGSSKKDNQKVKETELPRDTAVTQRNTRRDSSRLFTDRQEAKTNDGPVQDER